MLKAKFLVFTLFMITNTAWSDPINWYANKNIEIKKHHNDREGYIGKLYWGESVKVVDSTSHKDWVKIKSNCANHGKLVQGWVPRKTLKSPQEFVKPSIWQVEKYKHETASGDYGVFTNIDFQRNGRAQVSVSETGVQKPVKGTDCLTYQAGNLAQLRCGENSNITLTIQFDKNTGDLKDIPCSIGGTEESYITTHKKFTFSKYPTPQSQSRINRWLNGKLIGNDNGYAKFSTVKIYHEKTNYKVHFKSQFGFVCDLEFDAMGLPYILKACTSSKYDFDEPEKVVFLKCESENNETTCTGQWKNIKPWERSYKSQALMRFAIINKHDKN